MHVLGVVIGYFGLSLEGLLILRGVGTRLYRSFPLFFGYLVFCFLASLGIYIVYWRFPQDYPSAYWLYYLVTILVEISDQILRPFPAVRNLGRALTILISAGLGLVYILPTIIQPARRSRTLLDFALRASITKAVILVVLFYVARHYGSALGRNVGGLMLGFSIYVAINVTIMAGAKVFGSGLFAQILWFMAPLAYMLCALVWTVSLWELVPIARTETTSLATAGDAGPVAIELTRFNNELSKFLRK